MSWFTIFGLATLGVGLNVVVMSFVRWDDARHQMRIMPWPRHLKLPWIVVVWLGEILLFWILFHA